MAEAPTTMIAPAEEGALKAEPTRATSMATATGTTEGGSTTRETQESRGSKDVQSGVGEEEGGGEFTLLLFAAAQSYTDLDTLTLPAPMTLKELFDELERRYTGMKRKVLRSAAVTVNLEYVEFEVDDDGNMVGDRASGGEGVVIKKGDEVGIIPPVSSG